MDNIPCPIKAAALSDPDRVGLGQDDRQISFSELDRLVDGAVACLRSSGVKRGDVVAVLSDNSIEFALLFFAAMRGRFCLMPLNHRLTSDDYKEQLILAECLFVVAQNKFINRLTNIDGQLVNIELLDALGNNLPDKVPPSDDSITIDLDADALIMFTSGGRSKARGVVLRWAHLYFSARGLDEILKFKASDSWLATLPFYHIGGISILLRSILGRFKAVILEKFDPEQIFNAIKTNEASYLSVVPTMLGNLIDADRENILTKAQGIIVGGDGINLKLRKKIIEASLPIMTTYGMTETASMVTLSSKADFTERPNSSGKVLPYREIKISSSGGILVGGQTIAVRYLGSDQKIPNADGWFETDDLGQIDGEGNLTVSGRSDDVIISGGENIDLNRIKDALLNLPEISEAVVIGRFDEKWGQRPLAFIEATDTEISPEKIKGLLRNELPSIYIPDSIIVVDQLPLTGSGKRDIVVLKKAHPDLFGL